MLRFAFQSRFLLIRSQAEGEPRESSTDDPPPTRSPPQIAQSDIVASGDVFASGGPDLAPESPPAQPLSKDISHASSSANMNKFAVTLTEIENLPVDVYDKVAVVIGLRRPL